MKLKFNGKAPYRGDDPERKAQLVVKPGETIDVSDTKAKQLLKDYPRDWILSGGPKEEQPPIATTANHAAIESEDDDLPDISAGSKPNARQEAKRAKSKRR